jgi:hypothetical protein
MAIAVSCLDDDTWNAVIAEEDEEDEEDAIELAEMKKEKPDLGESQPMGFLDVRLLNRNSVVAR